MNTFKERCIELRKQDYTLNEIVKITGRPKTSIYEYIYDIPLSKDKLQIIRLANGIRARSIALARKGKSDRNFRRFTEWNVDNVTLLAHLIFDGTVNGTSCIYNNRNLSLLNKVEICMKYIYDYEPKRYLNKRTGVYRISYHNVALSDYLEIKLQELLRDVNLLTKALKREFVKAFFDDEGCVDFRPKRNLRQVRGYQKNVTVLFLIQTLLSNFDIKSRIVKPNEVVISGKENLQKFRKEVNFSPGVKLNGNRSNSIWKKPLDKRLLLDQAIKSFKK